MVGVIRKWEILSHPIVTIQCFGWRVFFRCLFARRNQTFLSLLTQARVFEQPLKSVAEFISQCIGLERQLMKVYESLSRRYAGNERITEFYDRLTHQEQDHAELLELCRAAASRGRWQERCWDRWRETVPETEKQLKKAEGSLEQVQSLTDSLRLVLEVESTQINRLFVGVVEATDPRLGQKFQAFRNAIKDHLGYICEQIPVLDPTLLEACQALRAKINQKSPTGVESIQG